MNSCLTCHNSSLQIRSPGRKNVRKAGAIKELHIKNTDKLSAKKKKKKKNVLINFWLTNTIQVDLRQY